MSRQNLQHQIKSALYDQFYSARGQSRHENKVKRKEYAHHDKIYSRQSLKNHLSRAKQFSGWLKEQHPEIKSMDEISRDVAIKYLSRQKDAGYSTRTVEADMSMINRLQVGIGNWDKEEALTKKMAGIPPRNRADITNNRGHKKSEIQYNEDHQKALNFGKVFGLRRSELVPDRQNDRYAVGQNSLYEKNNRIYCATVGKGGRYRTIEALESHQDELRAEYGQFIQKVDNLPTREEYIASYDKNKQFFKSMSNNIRVHKESRQYYANEKLAELEKNDRHFQLSKQNKLKSGHSRYKTNGREMARDHAQFISEQLGHARLYELGSYINV